MRYHIYYVYMPVHTSGSLNWLIASWLHSNILAPHLQTVGCQGVKVATLAMMGVGSIAVQEEMYM